MSKLVLPKRTDNRGRKLNINSLRRSEAMVKDRYLKGLGLKEIGEKYSAKGDQNYTAQAVTNRINDFQRRFPVEFAAIVGEAEALAAAAQAEATVETEAVTPELVTA